MAAGALSTEAAQTHDLGQRPVWTVCPQSHLGEARTEADLQSSHGQEAGAEEHSHILHLEEPLVGITVHGEMDLWHGFTPLCSSRLSVCQQSFRRSLEKSCQLWLPAPKQPGRKEPD